MRLLLLVVPFHALLMNSLSVLNESHSDHFILIGSAAALSCCSWTSERLRENGAMPC